MRTPSNERAAVEAGLHPARHVGGKALADEPGDNGSPSHDREGSGVDASNDRAATNTRRCILSGERSDPRALVRLALAPDGRVLPDVRAKAPGRGAWIGVDRAALQLALDKGRLRGALARAFKTTAIEVPADLPLLIEAALERAALDRLGLEARGGALLTGGERIAETARAGRLHLLLHAADAGVDGNRKLDQAWRVGRDREGSGEGGLVIAAPRTTLSLALGRENVVHIGVDDRGAAMRVRHALDRWHHFIGFQFIGQPCGSASQGTTPVRGACGDPAAEDRS